jgi:hypothetical protein
MALVKITMHVECEDEAEYLAVMQKLEANSPSDGRFTTKTLTGDEATNIIELVYEPTLQVV